MNNEFQYYNASEGELFAYYTIPKELTTNSRYKHISNDAKFLYGILRDRNQLSIKNNWIDEKGHIYIIFTRDEAMEILNVSNKIIVKFFKELTDIGLIKDVRQGLNKPNIIYVGKIISECKENQRKCKNYTSGNVENTLQKVKKVHASNTDINNTDINKKSVNQSLQIVKNDRQTDSILKTIIKVANVHQYPEPTAIFIEKVITDLWNDGAMKTKLKMNLTFDQIKDRLRLLRLQHIDTAMSKMATCKTNKELYFAKCLLTAIVEANISGGEDEFELKEM